MNDARRGEILRLAQGELVRSHARRRRRRTVAAAMTVLAVTITAAIVVMASDGSASRAHETRTTSAGDAPRTPETRDAPLEVVDAAPPRDDSAPREIARSSTDATTARIEIVTIERPSAGFVEVIDDAAFDRMLRSLPKSTGVAVIAGRTHIVANQEWKPAALIR